MSSIRYRDSDKSINNSGEDYSTLSDYHNSFYNAVNTSQLRMTIAPGTVKYFNREFIADNKYPFTTEAAITPIQPRSKTDDECDYSSYPKKSYS